MPVALPRVTFAVADPTSAIGRCANAAAAALGDAASIRIVPTGELIGRDLRECDRFVCDLATFAAARHLRELCAQVRDRTIALLVGAAATAAVQTGEPLADLRRNCGRVVVDSSVAARALRPRLLAPVHVIAADDLVAWPSAFAAILSLAPGSPDTVAAQLGEAQQWQLRGDPVGAFAAASRALQLAPDQPGIVADVARLLANLGEPERALSLCQSFLRQRPDADAVRVALAELGGAVPRPAAAIDAQQAGPSAPLPT